MRLPTPIRESFAAKLLAGLLGTVGLLMIVTWTVVQSETTRQVDAVAERATLNAVSLFGEIEEMQRQQLERVARPLTAGRRTLAVLDAAAESGDVSDLVGLATYELDLARLDDVLVAFTDARGRPLLTLHGARVVPGVDPVGLGADADAVLGGDGSEVQSYRMMDGALYSVRSRLIQLAGRAIGTLSLGLPLSDGDVARIGAQAGVEVCFVVGSACVTGTPRARQALARSLTEAAGRLHPMRMETASGPLAVRAAPLVERDSSQGWRVIAVPLEGVLAPFRRITNALLVGGGAALLLALLVSLALSRGLTGPVRALVAATGRVARGDYDTEVSVDSRDEIGTLAAAFNDMTRGLLLKERYRSVLNKVVSRDVAEELLRGNVELGGENREVTVLFADIRGFTSLTEGMEPQEVIGLLNECMERLSDAVEREGGVVDKFVGDELMAVFGAPLSQGDDALRALRAALRMQEAMVELNGERASRGEGSIGLGVGLNTGVAVAGNMGSRNRLNYTVLGDVVNLGARLCSSAGPGEILATAATVAAAGNTVLARPLGERSFRGFAAGAEVLHVEGVVPHRRDRGPGAVLAGALLLCAGALPAPAAAQAWPTLQELGLAYVSPSGALQVSWSGRLDVEALRFTGRNAGLAEGEGSLLAPRARLFTDVFLGDAVYGLVELRADRGEAPVAGKWDARVEQAFLRLNSAGGGLSVQAGRFASPFGSYPLRHLSEADPFVRPPLPYDYRTMMCASIAPPNTERLLAWRDDPATFRDIGAPPVWEVPYQWGVMLAGVRDVLSYRFAVMNSAPSSPPEAWGFDVERFRHPSVVAGLGVRVTPSLSLGASWDRGPWLEPLKKGSLPVGRTRWDYVQEIASVDLSWARGPVVARAEVLHDRWQVPNVGDDPVEWGYSLEVQTDLSAGLSAAVRAGFLDFRPLENGAATRNWDFDAARYEASLAYRLARNAGILASVAFNDQHAAIDPADDLLALRLWWAF